MSEPFDPADATTPEASWHALLQAAPEWTPSGPLLVVAPHPDDEVLGAGGLIHSRASAGEPVLVLSVTDGEAADIERPGLDRIRRHELHEALRRLSALHIEVRHAGLPDGNVTAHAERLRGLVAELAVPGTILVAPYEHDGHPDHDIVGRVCTEVARAAGLELLRYPVWVWHHTDPSAVSSLRWARFPLSVAARRAKAQALQCFESQLRPPSGAAILPAHVLAHFDRPYEAFVL